ncbi:unnamed protein product [Pleuronectes platessa]|uniref:Uncharacterized protein n=1 Tax=Pleuronectes platessa TaxID=8262 RepID=A0A9N7TLH3_PLEPL|nr:unnamed protein product [Pleuronectes platessa]
MSRSQAASSMLISTSGLLRGQPLSFDQVNIGRSRNGNLAPKGQRAEEEVEEEEEEEEECLASPSTHMSLKQISPVLIKRPESKQPITGVEWCKRELKTKGAVGADRWGGASERMNLAGITHTSIPTCQRVTNFQVGAGHWRAKCLGSEEPLGFQRGPLHWLGG